MPTVDEIYNILMNIVGFTRGAAYVMDNNATFHFALHCLTPAQDIEGVKTVREYLELGRKVARKAAFREKGAFVKIRDNGEIAIYWEPVPEINGLFMVVKPLDPRRGEIKTLFSPIEGKTYFDEQRTEGFNAMH